MLNYRRVFRLLCIPNTFVLQNINIENNNYRIKIYLTSMGVKYDHFLWKGHRRNLLGKYSKSNFCIPVSWYEEWREL